MGKKGLILLPDNWVQSEGVPAFQPVTKGARYDQNVYDETQWFWMELFCFCCSLVLILRSCIGFLSVRPDVCRRLPSDLLLSVASLGQASGPSRGGHPLPLAVTFPLSGRFGDFHPLEYVRAGRTSKKRASIRGSASCCVQL